MLKMFQKMTLVLLLPSILVLNGCSWINKDKVKPLPPIEVTPEIQVQPLWITRVGKGTDKKYFVMKPVIADGRLFVDDAKGEVIALSPQNASVFWKTKLDTPLSSGVGVGQGVVVVMTADGRAIALDQTTGKQLWEALLPNQGLAAPGVAQGLVIVKTIDGQVLALNSKTGKEVWAYGLTLPTLILRGGSTPVSAGNWIAIGFPSGKLSVLMANNGTMAWQRSVATSQGLSAIQQLVDIDADPIIANGVVYVATYQGNVAAISLQSGQVLWQHEMSAYSGMAIDSSHLYLSDAAGQVWAFNLKTGQVEWRQNRLAQREITGPALVGNELVMGDAQGNLYWLAKEDGHLMAKTIADAKVPFYAPPASLGNSVYVINSKGRLFAYSVPS